MPVDWQILLRILAAILQVLMAIPPETDHQPVAAAARDLINYLLPGPSHKGGNHA